jgi:hypothetical protein
MNFHIILGAMTIVAGMTVIGMGTDSGRVFSMNIEVVIGSIMVILGTLRLRNGLWKRKQ